MKHAWIAVRNDGPDRERCPHLHHSLRGAVRCARSNERSGRRRDGKRQDWGIYCVEFEQHTGYGGVCVRKIRPKPDGPLLAPRRFEFEHPESTVSAENLPF